MWMPLGRRWPTPAEEWECEQSCVIFPSYVMSLGAYIRNECESLVKAYIASIIVSEKVCVQLFHKVCDDDATPFPSCGKKTYIGQRYRFFFGLRTTIAYYFPNTDIPRKEGILTVTSADLSHASHFYQHAYLPMPEKTIKKACRHVRETVLLPHQQKTQSYYAKNSLFHHSL